MQRFNIQGLDRKSLGHVYGRNKGVALQAAVDTGLVTSRKRFYLQRQCLQTMFTNNRTKTFGARSKKSKTPIFLATNV